MEGKVLSFADARCVDIVRADVAKGDMKGGSMRSTLRKEGSGGTGRLWYK